MLAKPLNELTASEIVVAVKSGKATCEAVARACLDRIAVREPDVGAWHYLDPDLVLRQARALDRAGAKGPLAGVPVGMKDIIDTADMPTEYGSPIHRGHRPHMDAACVALTRRAGGIIMGKTVTTEFANRHPGRTVHPRDPRRTPGGSSSGSAAAVGDGMVPLGVGTQTTGSTIRPAAFCGCVGYRPTWGDIRCAGVMEAAGSLDTLGIIARSVEDVALYRDVIAGLAPEPLPDADPQALRVGFLHEHLAGETEPYAMRHLEECARKLAAAGATVTDVKLPFDFARIDDAHRWVSSFEFARNRAWEVNHHYDKISETLRQNRLKDGLGCPMDRYVAARGFMESQRPVLDRLFDDYDVLLTAPAGGEAPVGLQSTGNASFCTVWTSMHVPCITLPLFSGPNGLPVGAQLIGRRNADRRLFLAARWVTRRCNAA